MRPCQSAACLAGHDAELGTTRQALKSAQLLEKMVYTQDPAPLKSLDYDRTLVLGLAALGRRRFEEL